MGTISRARGPRAHTASIVAVASALVFLAGLSLFAPAPVTAVDFTLYGDAFRGWGITPASITSPGPTLIVTQGEMVHLSLFAADGFPHTWCIDYSGSGTCEAGENESAVFSSTTVPEIHMFFPTGAPGTYNYVCGVHGDLVMNGLIRITAAVRPVVSITAPTGTQRWTGGTPHDIVWTMTDPQDPITALRAWVNYSTSGSGGPWNPVAGPITGSTNPHSVTWAVPLVDTASAYVNVTVVDPSGNRGWAVTPVAVIDSTGPSVSGRTPPNGSSGIPVSTNIIVTFDEAMNRTATARPATAALQDPVSLAWIPVTYSWSSGDTVLTMDPVPTLAPLTMYRASINVSAMDASDPGNALSAASAWTFTTATGADLTPPQISNIAAVPPVAEYPAPVNVSATITDNDAVGQAFVNVILPDATGLNHSMTFISGSTWAWAQPYPLLGSYLYRVEAVDASGNWNRSAQGAFTVEDTTPPGVSNAAASPSPAEVYEPVNLTVSATDPFLATVDVAVNGTNYSMAPGAVAGTWYRVFTPMAAQAYPFIVWAGDSSGNFGSASGTVTAQDTKAPPMPMGLVATATVGAIQLSWNGVTAFDLNGYRVYRSTSASGPFTTRVGPATISGTAYTDQSVQPGVTYYYVVTSVDTGGRGSAPSNVASASVATPPGMDFTPVIIAGVAIAIIVAALAVALLLRRRREQPPKT